MKNIIENNEEFDAVTGELLTEVKQVEANEIDNILDLPVIKGDINITVNTCQLKESVRDYLEEFKGIAITLDSEKHYNLKSTELNKLSLKLDKKRIEVSNEIKKPSDLLKKAFDEIIQDIQSTRSNLLRQTSQFKEDRKVYIKELIEMEVNKQIKAYDLHKDYSYIEYDFLIKDSSVRTVALTKQAVEIIKNLIVEAKLLENTVLSRTLLLQKKCDDAGLSTYIHLNDVQDIIKGEGYEDLLDQRIERQKQIEENARQKQIEKNEEKEKQKNEEKEKEEKEKEEEEEERINIASEEIEKSNLIRRIGINRRPLEDLRRIADLLQL